MDKDRTVGSEDIRRSLEQFLGRRVQVAMAHGMGPGAEAVEFDQDEIREIREIVSEEDEVPRPGILALLGRSRLKIFAGDIERIEDEDEGYLTLWGTRYKLCVEDMAIAGKSYPQD